MDKSKSWYWGVIALVGAKVLDSVVSWAVPDDYEKFKANIRLLSWMSEPSGLTIGQGMLLAAVMCLLGGIVSHFLGADRAKSKAQSQAEARPVAEAEAKPKVVPFQPNILENKILKFFWENEASIEQTAGGLASHTDYSSNEVQHALDQLLARGYLKDAYHSGAQHFRLSTAGRAACANLFGHPAAMAPARPSSQKH